MKISNIKIERSVSFPHLHQASCFLSVDSYIMEFGATEEIALENLRRYVTEVLHIKWPDKEEE